jgi:transposase
MSAYIGLDVHKDWTFATVLEVVAQRKLANENVPSFLENFNVEKIGLESSTYIVPLYRALVDRGFRVEVGHPKKTRYIAEARTKSDKVDSKAIAELVRLDALPKAICLLQKLPVYGKKLGVEPSL